MLRFAFVAGLIALACSALVALLALSGAPIAARASIYFALFVSVFVTFAPAILGHPARTASGSEVTVRLGQVLRTAALWTVLLAGAAVTAFVATLGLGPGETFSVNDGELAGRSDRQLTLASFFAVFHATAVMIASSGMRYWTALPALPLAAFATPGPAAKSFGYRVADHSSWWQVGLELGAVLLVWLQAKDFAMHSSGWLRYALIAAFLLPVLHAMAKLFGSISFALEGEYLVVRHFPFFFRNRRIRVRDINGIQVNPEHDRKGNQSHYSLIVIGLSLGTDRIVHYVRDHEQAAALAQRIEATIAPARSLI